MKTNISNKVYRSFMRLPSRWVDGHAGK